MMRQRDSETVVEFVHRVVEHVEETDKLSVLAEFCDGSWFYVHCGDTVNDITNKWVQTSADQYDRYMRGEPLPDTIGARSFEID